MYIINNYNVLLQNNIKLLKGGCDFNNIGLRRKYISFKQLKQDTFERDIRTSNIEGRNMPIDKTFSAIINEFKCFSQVQAIAVGGSRKANTSDSKSDIDVYIFTDKEIPVEERLKIAQKYSSKYEVGSDYFGAGDEFFVDAINQQLDIMFFDKKWMEKEVDNVWIKHNPSNGYSTCFLFTLKNCEAVFDRNGWLSELKKRIDTPYPNELKKNIIKRNMMLLKDKPFSSYYDQIEKAIAREDYNSINHRIAAFMASYFDIIFANNELLHPGEKKLVNYAQTHCKILPEDFTGNINRLLVQPNSETLDILNDMVCKLKDSISLEDF